MKREARMLAKLHLPDRTVEITDTLGRIDYDDLKGESERIGAEVIWFGVLAAAAKRRASQATLATRVKEASLFKKYRQRAKALGEKVTEGDLKESVHLDPEYAKVFEELFEKEEQASIIESTKFALVQKSRDLNALTNVQAAQAERLELVTHPTGARTPMRAPVTKQR